MENINTQAPETNELRRFNQEEMIFVKHAQQKVDVMQFFLEVIEMNEFEKIEAYSNKIMFKRLVLKIWYVKALLCHVCGRIISNRVFDNMVLAVIIWNSFLQTIPEDGNGEGTSGIEWFFIVFYTVEMLLKVIGMGLVFTRGAYLRDPWNSMDIIIVITSWVPIILGSSAVDLSTFRTLRILRPLRTIKNIKSLRRILMAII